MGGEKGWNMEQKFDMMSRSGILKVAQSSNRMLRDTGNLLSSRSEHY